MSFSQIAVIDHATGLPYTELSAFVRALDDQIFRDFATAWGRYAVPWVALPGAKLTKQAARLHLWSTARSAREAGVMGYHTTTGADYVPEGHVFVETTRLAREDWTVVASHEALEMLVDPWVNLDVSRAQPDNVELWPYEVCDAVQGLYYKVRGVPLSNFVYPEFFIDGADGPFDHLRALAAPFEIHETGYCSIRRVTGSTLASQDIFGARYPSWRKEKRDLSRKAERQRIPR